MPKPQTFFRCKNRKAIVVVVFVSRLVLRTRKQPTMPWLMKKYSAWKHTMFLKNKGFFGAWLLGTKDEIWFTLISYFHIAHSSYTWRKPLSHHEQAIAMVMLSKPSTPVENNLVSRCYKSPQQRYIWWFQPPSRQRRWVSYGILVWK